MFRLIFLVSISALLCGCQSEIDKCVSDNVDGWEAKQERNKQTGTGFPDNRTKAEMKGLFRLGCLETANKRNQN